jgi:hypothetical protein
LVVLVPAVGAIAVVTRADLAFDAFVLEVVEQVPEERDELNQAIMPMRMTTASHAVRGQVATGRVRARQPRGFKFKSYVRERL